jgi:hypothetical protein
MMDLIDTSKLMISKDYKDRFKAEYYQLKIRRDKLSKTILNYDAGKLEFEPISSIYLLKTQLDAMNTYLNILQMRAMTEGIEIDF